MVTAMHRYRLVVGMTGSVQGHVVSTSATTERGARIALGKALAAYNGDGWGRIEYLRTPAAEAQTGQDMWDRI